MSSALASLALLEAETVVEAVKERPVEHMRTEAVLMAEVERPHIEIQMVLGAWRTAH